MAPCVTPISSAAREKLPSRAAASKARSALSGGKGGRGGLTGMLDTGGEAEIF